MIVGEIREHDKLRGKSDDGDDVGFGHLLLHEFFGRVVRADQVVGLHGREIEEQDDQAAVAQLVAGALRRRACSVLRYPPARRWVWSSALLRFRLPSMSSYEKVEMSCALPSSVTMN